MNLTDQLNDMREELEDKIEEQACGWEHIGLIVRERERQRERERESNHCSGWQSKRAGRQPIISKYFKATVRVSRMEACELAEWQHLPSSPATI